MANTMSKSSGLKGGSWTSPATNCAPRFRRANCNAAFDLSRPTADQPGNRVQFGDEAAGAAAEIGDQQMRPTDAGGVKRGKQISPQDTEPPQRALLPGKSRIFVGFHSLTRLYLKSRRHEALKLSAILAATTDHGVLRCCNYCDDETHRPMGE